MNTSLRSASSAAESSASSTSAPWPFSASGRAAASASAAPPLAGMRSTGTLAGGLLAAAAPVTCSCLKSACRPRAASARPSGQCCLLPAAPALWHAARARPCERTGRPGRGAGAARASMASTSPVVTGIARRSAALCAKKDASETTKIFRKW